MKKALVSLIATLCLTVAASANPYDLPNDCAIVATEAYARLNDSAAWCHILRFDIIFPDHVSGHAVCVWQIELGGKVCVYDRNGTMALETSSRDPRDIVSAMQKVARPDVKLVTESACFIQ
jgi:hypothetical protein